MSSMFKTDQDGDYAEMRLGETLDFSHDWADFLAKSGADSIAPSGSAWAAPNGVTVTDTGVSGAVTYAFFTPTAPGIFEIDNTVITSGGRVKKEIFRIVCQ